MYHFLKPQLCQVCGTRWGRTFNEYYIRLGRPVIECPACWVPIQTGRREWRDLSGREKAIFFAQGFGYVLPVVGLLALGLAGTWFYADDFDFPEMARISGALIGICLAGIFLRSFFQVAASMRRTSAQNRRKAATKN